MQIADGGNELLPGAIKIYEPASKQIRKAGSFSVDMRGAYINKSYDVENDRFRIHGGKQAANTNDLLIASNFQTGTSPTVQMVHFLKEKQPIGEFVGNFFKTMVCSFTDFQDNHLTLECHVYDIDSYEDVKDMVSSISSMAGNFAGTFPVIAPYLAAGNTIARAIAELRNSLDKHDAIIDSNLRLTITDEQNSGYQILQTGHWVCFSISQEVGKLALDPYLRIINKDTGKHFTDCSYAIYTIRDEPAQEPTWEIDQKVAKLLSELEGKGNSGKAAVDFLRDTIEGYNKFKKLKRFQELQSKSNRTTEEEAVFNLLKNDPSIADFTRLDNKANLPSKATLAD